jgi:hypothetical protein
LATVGKDGGEVFLGALPASGEKQLQVPHRAFRPLGNDKLR